MPRLMEVNVQIRAFVKVDDDVTAAGVRVAIDEAFDRTISDMEEPCVFDDWTISVT